MTGVQTCALPIFVNYWYEIDGPKVGSVAVSPRGDLRMPSDAARRIWMDEVEKLDPEADR